jgi:collagenase-like PrtC family protease
VTYTEIVDSVSQQNICEIEDINELKEVTIDELKVSEPTQNSILWVKSITKSC